MDNIEENGAHLEFRTFRYAKFDISLNQTKVIPKYDYNFKTVNEKIINYNLTSFKVNLRYGYKEKFIQTLDQRVSMGTKYPILYISYIRGIKNFLNGDFNYNKIETRITKNIVWKTLGETDLNLEGGLIDNPLPYGSLFTGEGSFNTKVRLLFKNSFQTLEPYEFLSDRYANFFFTHNFKSLLFKKRQLSTALSSSL